MSEITMIVPDEILSALETTPERFALELRLAGAIKLYEIGEISSGAAASLAGIPKPLFLERLADYGVDTFQTTEADLRREKRLE
jgi:predicted HTH domain antitoxin